MYERFTDRARKVMKLANEEAQSLNQQYIGSEHILLGLMKEGSGVAANVLRNFDIDLHKIRLEIEKFVQLGPDMVAMGKLPQTPRAKKVIEYSIEEARNLNHNYVGTEHLLLGLLREQQGMAAQVLVNLGLKLEDVREEVESFLGSKTDGSHRDPGSSGFELLARRLGLWMRQHQYFCLFLGGLLSTFAGATIAVSFWGSDQANSGALIGSSAFVAWVAYMAYCIRRGGVG
jgi:ATP-dependent Clp protease ATP-binding subunit ClpA